MELTKSLLKVLQFLVILEGLMTLVGKLKEASWEAA